YLFRPDGYSLNAIREAEYYTVHVTPEEISSYASFETNYRFLGHVQETIHKVIDIFRPKAYDLILFQMNQIPQPADHGYQMSRHVHQQLTCGLDVRFLTYFRLPTGIDSACELHDRKESEPCNPLIK